MNYLKLAQDIYFEDKKNNEDMQGEKGGTAEQMEQDWEDVRDTDDTLGEITDEDDKI